MQSVGLRLEVRMSPSTRRAALYARVSTLDQEPENPLAELRRYVAARIAARFEDVGEFSVSDLRTQIERRTHHYRDAHLLALHVIRASGRYLGHGTAASWTFLILKPLDRISIHGPVVLSALELLA